MLNEMKIFSTLILTVLFINALFGQDKAYYDAVNYPEGLYKTKSDFISKIPEHINSDKLRRKNIELIE